MNRRRVVALLRALLAELEADENATTGERTVAPKTKPTAEDHAKAAAALRRAGVLPRGAWQR